MLNILTRENQNPHLFWFFFVFSRITISKNLRSASLSALEHPQHNEKKFGNPWNKELRCMSLRRTVENRRSPSFIIKEWLCLYPGQAKLKILQELS